MGNTLSDDECTDIARKAIIPFRVRNNGFQVDYKIFKFKSFTKAKIDEATDTKYDDSFLELNTRSKIVGDIRKVLTISAESISTEYANLRKNYYARICFGVLMFFIGLILTNIGLVQNELPKGRIMIIFGGLCLLFTGITLIIVIYTDRRLRLLNKEFVENCVRILEKEKIVTWTASFQHLLFDIIYPYNGKSGVGAVILTPNPYFEMISKTTDNVEDLDIHINDDKKTSKLKLPIPQWAIDESISEGPNEEAPLIRNDKHLHVHYQRDKSLILPPSDDNDGDGDGDNDGVDEVAEVEEEEDLLNNLISAAEDNDESSKSDIVPPSDDEEEEEDEEEDDDDDNDDYSGNDNVEDGSRNEKSKKSKSKSKSKGKMKMKIKKGVSGKKKSDKNDKMKMKVKSPPKPYTGFDDVSKENVAKIHGDLIQRFFHENPEDIEGHGEDTALMENINIPLALHNNNNNGNMNNMMNNNGNVIH